MEEDAKIYKLAKDYRIVRIKGNKCSLFFKNRQNQLLASLEGCSNTFTQINIASDKKLSEIEKAYLLSFVKAKKYTMSKEVAATLGVSVIKYLDGREEYFSERRFKRRVERGLDFARVYAADISAHSLTIAPDSKDCFYDLTHANISKLVVSENATVNIDLRDNTFIESVVVGDKFSGTINLSRSSVESVFIGNNCHCHLTIADAKKCFNLQIADIYSGNLNVSNSCLYAFGLGYYSYADLILSNNIIKKGIEIGDSFRGNFYALNQNVDVFKVGDDCKGTVKVSDQGSETGVKKLIVGDDFSGVLNLSGDESLKVVEVGRKNGGRIDASLTPNLERMSVGKYFNGNVNLSSSAVQNIFVAYGASGCFDLTDSNRLGQVHATIDNHLIFNGISPVSTETADGSVYYRFASFVTRVSDIPFYQKIYQTIQNHFH